MPLGLLPVAAALVCVLGPRSFRRLRLDRNRNMITLRSSSDLAGLRIGSWWPVGRPRHRPYAGRRGHMRATAAGGLRRVGTVQPQQRARHALRHRDEQGPRRGPAHRRARPLSDVQIMTLRLDAPNRGGFLDGLDIVVEECDSLDIKVAVRETARTRGMPVLMASSDRGLIDVERYDLDPAARSCMAFSVTSHRRPRLARLVPATRSRMCCASSTPQAFRTAARPHWSRWATPCRPGRSSPVTSLLGAAAVAEAVQRIGLAEHLPSGRVRIDVDGIRALGDPVRPRKPKPAAANGDGDTESSTPVPRAVVAAAAQRAPSGGNMQPWRVTTNARHSVTVALAPKYTSTMDVAYRGSAVAIGAAPSMPRAAAAARVCLGRSTIVEDSDARPASAPSPADGQGRHRSCRAVPAVLDRQTNRHRGLAAPLPSTRRPAPLLQAGRAPTAHGSARDHRDRIDRIADILAAIRPDPLPGIRDCMRKWSPSFAGRMTIISRPASTSVGSRSLSRAASHRDPAPPRRHGTAGRMGCRPGTGP